LAAYRQEKSAKNREPRKLDLLGSQLPRITFLAVLMHCQANRFSWQPSTAKPIAFPSSQQPPSKGVILAALYFQVKGISWQPSTAK